MKKLHRMAASFIVAMMLASPMRGFAKPLDQEPKPEEPKKLEEYREKSFENKLERKAARLAAREAMRLNYTEEEYLRLKELGEAIQKKHPKVKVIPAENIISRRGLLKFDTPPVIKEGRTLIPVRALSEGFGATVSWESATKTVIIEKDGSRILIQLENPIAMVNNDQVELDVPAEIMNSRTLVPLRFILESLGLKVDYDQETGIIEIEEIVEASNEPVEAAEISEDAVVVLAEPSSVQDIVVITVTPKSEEQQDPVVVIHSNQK